MTSDNAAAAACNPATQSCRTRRCPTSRCSGSVVKYFITGSSGFDSLTLDPQRPGPYRDRVSICSPAGRDKTDLSAFEKRGGKLLLMHGLATDWSRPRRRRSTTSAHRRHGRAQGAQVRGALHHPGSGTRPRSPSAAGGGSSPPGIRCPPWTPVVESGQAPSASSPRSECCDQGRTARCASGRLAKYNGAGDSQQRGELYLLALRRRR